jgi:dCTP deaminase
MILKADRLAQRLTEGEKPANLDPLVITPSPRKIQELAESGAGSIDLRLGTWFLTLRQARMPCLDIDKPGGHSKFTKMHFVAFGDEYYLHPRNFVLAITLEWMRLPKDLAAYVTGKSSWGRRGLIIATATGVHPGYKGCLTLELSNVGDVPIAINPGMLICQLFFHTVDTGSNAVDRSAFNGYRRPSLGAVKPDPIAEALAKAHT